MAFLGEGEGVEKGRTTKQYLYILLLFLLIIFFFTIVTAIENRNKNWPACISVVYVITWSTLYLLVCGYSNASINVRWSGSHWKTCTRCFHNTNNNNNNDNIVVNRVIWCLLEDKLDILKGIPWWKIRDAFRCSSLEMDIISIEPLSAPYLIPILITT